MAKKEQKIQEPIYLTKFQVLQLLRKVVYRVNSKSKNPIVQEVTANIYDTCQEIINESMRIG